MDLEVGDCRCLDRRVTGLNSRTVSRTQRKKIEIEHGKSRVCTHRVIKRKLLILNIGHARVSNPDQHVDERIRQLVTRRLHEDIQREGEGL